MSVSRAPISALASIRIFGVGLDMDRISGELGIRPSETHRKGESSPTSRPYSEDMWRIDSPHGKAEPLEVHLRWLTQVLQPRYDFIRRLRGEYEVSSYCGISTDASSCRFRLSPDAFGVFAELGIAMDLTIIFVGESDTPSEADNLAPAQIPGTTTSFEVVGNPRDVTWVAGKLDLLAPYASQTGALAESGGAAFWIVSAPQLQYGSLDTQLIWLASELSPYASILRSATGSVSSLVRCALRSDNDICEQSFSPEGLTFLISLGIPLEINATFIAVG